MVQSGIYLYRGGFVGGRALRPRWARSGRLRVGVRCRHSLRPQRAGPLAWQAVPCPPPALFRGPAAQLRAVGQARLETPSGVFPGGLQPPATGPPPVHPARPAACMQPAVRAGFGVPLPGRQALLQPPVCLATQLLVQRRSVAANGLGAVLARLSAHAHYCHQVGVIMHQAVLQRPQMRIFVLIIAQKKPGCATNTAGNQRKVGAA